MARFPMRQNPPRPIDWHAAPWDLHGLKNTGTTPVRFFVWKWNGKGVRPIAKPK